MLINHKKAYTVGSTDKVPTVCYEEPTPPTENRGSQEQRSCGAFMGGQGPNARSIAWSETVSPSLKTTLCGGNAVPEVVYPTACHVACYGIDSQPMDSRIRLQDPSEPVQTLSREMYKGTADVPMVLIDNKPPDAAPPPEHVFQNTGHGWWTEAAVCETVRTPCGGDAMKANLIVEELDDIEE